jgi:hypothetical protein
MSCSTAERIPPGAINVTSVCARAFQEMPIKMDIATTA